MKPPWLIACDGAHESLKMTNRPESENVQSFERRSSTYEDSLFQGLFFDRIHRIALNSIPAEINPESIMDIGCGTGRLLRKAAIRWPTARLIGVDPAEGMVKEARRLTIGAQFYVSSAESLPLPDESVDLVMSTVSFHHWRDQVQALKQVARVLHPGGIFVLADILWPYGLQKIIRHGRLVNSTILSEMFALSGLNIQLQRRRMSRFLLVTIGKREN
jgi:ubiquinone/menaquinone biosynthesis C-methylase UbiE